MNNLSWFIYFAEVLPSLSWLIFFVGVFVGVSFLAHVLFAYSKEYPAEGILTGLTKPKYRWVGYSLVLLIISNLIPQKSSLYLIAGVETAEAVATSEKGQEVLEDIHEVIKFQLKTMKEKP